MKIAYIVRWDVSQESGVLKKVAEQVRTWTAHGHEARLFALSQSGSIWNGLRDMSVEVVSGANPLTRGMRMTELADRVRRWKPDVGYLRFTTYYRGIERLMRQLPTVVEVNSNDLSEYILYLPRYQYLYHRATRERIFRNAAGLVCVTYQLARDLSRFGRTTAVIANGIDLTQFATLPPPARPGMRAVFIGAAGAIWHGTDKISRLAQQLPNWRFDLIGVAPDASFPANVSAHGALRRSDYKSLMQEADVAIGTLALHRKNMDEACPLKVREYLANGLPCINGYLDTDFIEGAPFLLQLPNTPDNVDGAGDEIDRFARNWKGRRVKRSAVSCISTEAKEIARLEFLGSVAAGCPDSSFNAHSV